MQQPRRFIVARMIEGPTLPTEKGWGKWRSMVWRDGIAGKRVVVAF